MHTYMGMTAGKLQERILKHTVDIKRSKLSIALSRLNQDAYIDILFFRASIIGHASQYNKYIISPFAT